MDAVIALPLIWGAYKGFKRGLIFEAAMLTGIVLGIYFGFKLSGWMSGLLSGMIDKNSILMPALSFLVIFGIIILIMIFLAKLLEGILKITSLNFFNKAGGALFGILKFALVLSVIFWLFKPFHEKYSWIDNHALNESLLYPAILNTGTFIQPVFTDIKEEFREHVGNSSAPKP
jgi:membrane protein required for colicin V production